MHTLIKSLEDYFNGYNKIKKVIARPSNMVDREEAHDILVNLYCEHRYMFPDNFRYNVNDNIHAALDNIGLEWSNHSGRFISRLMRALPEFSDYAGILGDRITRRAYHSQPAVYYLSIADTIFWYDGNFGKDDSCWWNSFSESRDVFIDDANGIGLLWHRNDQDYRNGIGRLWIAPIRDRIDGRNDDLLFCFNQYGESGGIPIRIERTAQILTELIPNTKTVKGYLRNDVNCDIPYINGSGMYIAPIDSSIREDHHVTVEWGRYMDECYECNNDISEDEINHSDINGHDYCESCFNDIFTCCNHCGEEMYRRNAARVNYDYYCNSCLNRYFTECSNCNEYFYNDEITEQDYNPYCEDCFQSEFTQCNECNEYYSNDEMKDGYCNGCYPEEIDQTSFLDALTAD